MQQKKILSKIQIILIHELNKRILDAIHELYENYKTAHLVKCYSVSDPFKKFKNNLFENFIGNEEEKLCKLLVTVHAPA